MTDEATDGTVAGDRIGTEDPEVVRDTDGSVSEERSIEADGTIGAVDTSGAAGTVAGVEPDVLVGAGDEGIARDSNGGSCASNALRKVETPYNSCSALKIILNK